MQVHLNHPWKAELRPAGGQPTVYASLVVHWKQAWACILDQQSGYKWQAMPSAEMMWLGKEVGLVHGALQQREVRKEHQQWRLPYFGNSTERVESWSILTPSLNNWWCAIGGMCPKPSKPFCKRQAQRYPSYGNFWFSACHGSGCRVLALVWNSSLAPADTRRAYRSLSALCLGMNPVCSASGLIGCFYILIIFQATDMHYK